MGFARPMQVWSAGTSTAPTRTCGRDPTPRRRSTASSRERSCPRPSWCRATSIPRMSRRLESTGRRDRAATALPVPAQDPVCERHDESGTGRGRLRFVTAAQSCTNIWRTSPRCAVRSSWHRQGGATTVHPYPGRFCSKPRPGLGAASPAGTLRGCCNLIGRRLAHSRCNRARMTLRPCATLNVRRPAVHVGVRRRGYGRPPPAGDRCVIYTP